MINQNICVCFYANYCYIDPLMVQGLKKLNRRFNRFLQ